jgi:hypothetical protein
MPDGTMRLARPLDVDARHKRGVPVGWADASSATTVLRWSTDLAQSLPKSPVRGRSASLVSATRTGGRWANPQTLGSYCLILGNITKPGYRPG